MKHVVTLAATVVLFACGVATAQQPPSTYEHLKDYEPMIGTWRFEGPLPEEMPPMVKKGTPVVITASWERVLNKSVVANHWSIEIEGRPVVAGKSLAGWDPAQKRIVLGDVTSAGGYSLGIVTFDNDAKTSTLLAEGVDAEGRETSFTNVISFLDKDTITFRVTERQGGAVEGPSPTYTMKRVGQAESEELTVSQVKLEELAFMVGEWKSTDAEGNSSKVEYEWMNNRNFIRGTFGGATEIIGWNFETNQFMSWGFGNGGGHGSMPWTKVDGGWKVAAKPHWWFQNGPTGTMQWVIKPVSKDEFHLEGSMGATGKEETTWKVVNKRIKD